MLWSFAAMVIGTTPYSGNQALWNSQRNIDGQTQGKIGVSRLLLLHLLIDIFDHFSELKVSFFLFVVVFASFD